jgi:hypothetical protein
MYRREEEGRGRKRRERDEGKKERREKGSLLAFVRRPPDIATTTHCVMTSTFA